MQTSLTKCPFCGVTAPMISLDGARFGYNCCDELDRESERADEEQIPFHFLTISDTPAAAFDKWQCVCQAMTGLLQPV